MTYDNRFHKKIRKPNQENKSAADQTFVSMWPTFFWGVGSMFFYEPAIFSHETKIELHVYLFGDVKYVFFPLNFTQKWCDYLLLSSLCQFVKVNG